MLVAQEYVNVKDRGFHFLVGKCWKGEIDSSDLMRVGFVWISAWIISVTEMKGESFNKAPLVHSALIFSHPTAVTGKQKPFSRVRETGVEGVFAGPCICVRNNFTPS